MKKKSLTMSLLCVCASSLFAQTQYEPRAGARALGGILGIAILFVVIGIIGGLYSLFFGKRNQGKEPE